MSAGAMVLTPSLNLLPEIDNEPVTKPNRKALGLIDFEFYPHYRFDEPTRAKLHRYAHLHKKLIYACNDDAGIMIERETLTPIGLGSIAKFDPSSE